MERERQRERERERERGLTADRRLAHCIIPAVAELGGTRQGLQVP